MKWLLVKLTLGLRYIYIIHKTWLENKFSDHRNISSLAIILLFATFLLCSGLNLSVSISCGWPTQTIFEMPIPQSIICVTTLFGTYFILNSIRSQFHQSHVTPYFF